MDKKCEVLLGQKVTDIITGIEGICIGITQYLYGVERIEIQPPLKGDGAVPDTVTIDVNRLRVIDNNPVMQYDSKPLTFEIGQTGLDPISGYKGIVVGYCDYISGCRRVGLQQKYNPSVHKEFDTGMWFYENQLEFINSAKENKVKVSENDRKTGGPGMMPAFKHNESKR